MTPLLNPPKSRSAHLKKTVGPHFFCAGARAGAHIRGPHWGAKDAMATSWAAIGSWREMNSCSESDPPQKCNERSRPQTRGPAPLCFVRAWLRGRPR
jgi:hypothetical protein